MCKIIPSYLCIRVRSCLWIPQLGRNKRWGVSWQQIRCVHGPGKLACQRRLRCQQLLRPPRIRSSVLHHDLGTLPDGEVVDPGRVVPGGERDGVGRNRLKEVDTRIVDSEGAVDPDVRPADRSRP